MINKASDVVSPPPVASDTAIPDDDSMLGRPETAAGMTRAGFPISPATLATLASRGSGPPFYRFGSRVIYRFGDALDWARSKRAGPVLSTSALQVSGGATPLGRGLAQPEILRQACNIAVEESAIAPKQKLPQIDSRAESLASIAPANLAKP